MGGTISILYQYPKDLTSSVARNIYLVNCRRLVRQLMDRINDTEDDVEFHNIKVPPAPRNRDAKPLLF